MARTAPISLRVEDGTKAALEAAAKADGRTLAAYVERVLLMHIAELSRREKAKG